MRPLLFALILSACAATETTTIENPVSLFPDALTFETAPKLGSLTLMNGSDVLSLSTVDFSVGAIDPSAWFQMSDGEPTLSIIGFSPDDINLTGVYGADLRATFPAVARGVSVTAELAIYDSSPESPVAKSGTPFIVTVEAITPLDNSVYSRIEGSFSGALCNIAVVQGDVCVPIFGRFDTSAAVVTE